MKALVYTDTNRIVYRDEPDPVPGPDDVLVKVEATGICGSDMHAFHGRDPRRVPPLILGHEVAGSVVSGTDAGRRIVINPLITCGRCAYCDTGRSHLCADRELIGMRLAGAYAEYVTIPSTNIIGIPDSMNAVHASLTEPTATALHALNLAREASHRPLAELNTLVIGGGAVGFLAALLLRAYGCKRLVVSETNPLRRESLVAHTGCRVHDPINDPALENDSFDLVVDAVGGGVTRAPAMAAVTPGGIFVHIGLMDAKGDLDIRKLTLFEVKLLGVYCYTPADVRAAAEALGSGLLGDLSWVETRPLADGAAAFDDLDKGRTAAPKIVLVP
ncbi:galactitol-1-phosphate 5-dehydrogenase [Desulfosarcina alkanivorans]|uniref:Galactitol-1-phosphate 5-dehydrogenase n=1 Tax=Desulfosarcina alkanivorans TaxID=571177 RepID=A0A5K7Z1W1_9BACT|nr:alcohol dehydrogenase catalytic domain-containing protein [Desulfosarcina alkanivorans]BBO72474.1 galactitol-1-phosphate 5-dehydrogenase [Desulfosarcina alkanivorans]